VRGDGAASTSEAQLNALLREPREKSGARFPPERTKTISWGVADVKRTGKTTSWREEQLAPPSTLSCGNCACSLSHWCLESTRRCHDLWTTSRSRSPVSRQQYPKSHWCLSPNVSFHGTVPIVSAYFPCAQKARVLVLEM